jgi:hypothetical protein
LYTVLQFNLILIQQSFQLKGRRRIMVITTYLVINCVSDVIGRRPETVEMIGNHEAYTIFFYALTWLFHFMIFRDNVTEEINDALSNQIEY